MKNAKTGVTLIELLVVIAIVGILAALALPMYRGYIIRARLTEVEKTMLILKSAVTTYYHDQEGSWPNCPSINEIINSLGVGLASISRISSATVSSVNGRITLIVQNIDPMVDGESLMLTPNPNGDGSISWAWGWSANFPVHLTPKNP